MSQAGKTFAALDELERSLANVRPEEAPALVVRLAALQSMLATRLVRPARNGDGTAVAQPEQLLTVKEAARLLGVSCDWLYRRARKLPFTVELGPRQLRFSATEIDRYIRHRAARRS